MDQLKLAELVYDVPSLRALFVMALPDGVLYDSWTRDDEEWPTDGTTSYFADLLRINRQGLRTLQFWPDDLHITVESTESVVVLAESGRFAVGFVFEPRLQLGLLRLHVRRILAHVGAELPEVEAVSRSQAARLIERLEQEAPDAHAVLVRLALRTGIDLELLQNPDRIPTEEIPALEQSIKDILGADQLSL